MAKELRTVEIHELVYGSAAHLLEPGASDLGVIASTRDFPSDAARRLASHRGFTRDGRADGAVKYIVGVLGGRLEFTRIQMGTDHTGRTIPFARHLLLPLTDGICWGDLVRSAAAYAKDPRQATAGWITPLPRLSLSPASQPPGNDIARVIAAAAETVMRYHETKRPVLLVHVPPASPDPEFDPFLPLVAAIGDVLPKSSLSSLVAATHAVDVDDRLAEASVLATYPGTSFHAEMTGRSGSRRPLVIDVARAAAEGPSEPPSAFIKATFADLIAGQPGRFAGLCDRLRAKRDLLPLVVDIAKALNAVETKPELSTAEAFITTVKTAGGSATGMALDRELLQRLAVETIEHELEGLAKNAVGQPGGVGRLSSLLAIDETLQARATLIGIALLTKGERSNAKVLAQALADVGEEAIAVVRQVGGNLPGCQAFLELVEPVAASNEFQDNALEPAMVAERKQRPQRRNAVPRPHVISGVNARVRYGSLAAEGSPWTWRLVTLVLFSPALLGVGYPVWREYKPLAQATDTKLAVAETKPMSSAAGARLDGKRQAMESQWWDAAHRKALSESITQARPRLILPGILCLVSVGFLLFNGVLTQWAFRSLRMVCGEFLATALPTLVMLAISAAGFFVGYTAGPSNQGVKAVSDEGVKTDTSDDRPAKGSGRRTSASEQAGTGGIVNSVATPAADSQPEDVTDAEHKP